MDHSAAMVPTVSAKMVALKPFRKLFSHTLSPDVFCGEVVVIQAARLSKVTSCVVLPDGTYVY